MTTSRQRTNRASGQKPKRLRRYMQSKLALAFIIVAVALFALSLRILWIIHANGDSYSKTILDQQQYTSTTIPFRRGTITDRNQTVLAASEQVYNLILDSSVLTKEADVDATIDALVTCFGYDREDLESKLSVDNTSTYYRYATKLEEDAKTTFEAYEETYNQEAKNQKKDENVDSDSVGLIDGVWFESEYKRVYPYNSLACTVLGFSGSDSSMGNWGIEQYYNSYLTGTNGRSYGYMNTDGTIEQTTKEAEDGCTVITTLDFTIQQKVEEIMAQFTSIYSAENVGILVMDPDNAEILAMVTDSSYDLNNPADLTAFFSESEIDSMSSKEKSTFLNKLWRNFMISDTYEPGSTAKAFTVAAALEENLTSVEDSFVCDGGQQLASDTYVRCSHYHGEVTLEEALAFSCNDAMMQLGSKMGKSLFCKYQDMFGLGKLTGIDLPGEASGMLYSEDDMSVVDLGTNTFGQNFTVTMVQMAAAYASILNGGSYYQPHVVKQILSADGDVVKEIGSSVVRETVSESTAQIIREALEMCVESDSSYATGKKARISGYTVGGKTGTAEKYPRGSGEYLLSFMGFAPAEDPQVIVYVIVDNPVDENGEAIQSASIAVQLEQKVMKAIADYMNLSATGGYITEIDNDLFVVQETDADGNPVEVETDEDGNPVIDETDEDGNPIDSDEAEDEDDREDVWAESSPASAAYSDMDEADGDEVIPDGGYISGEDTVSDENTNSDENINSDENVEEDE